MPSYIYDPQVGSYTSAYSPVQPSMHQNFQQTPVSANLSSPQQQQQPSFLTSYQTPQQPAHQLYIQTSNITPPTSLSPNDTPSTNRYSFLARIDCLCFLGRHRRYNSNSGKSLDTPTPLTWIKLFLALNTIWNWMVYCWYSINNLTICRVC